MNERELGFSKNLRKARFDRIFKGEQLDNFNSFLRKRAVAAGGFVINLPVAEGGLFWVLYKVEEVVRRRGKSNCRLSVLETFFPQDPSDRSIPEEFGGYPVWWFE